MEKIKQGKKIKKRYSKGYIGDKLKCKHNRKGIFQGKVFCKSCKLILNENVFRKNNKEIKGGRKNE